jgi:flagellar hook-associated protein 1 FlgK
MALSTFLGLETTLRGLMAQQQALDTTAHNIANASTPGYSRQVAVMSETPPYADTGVASGTVQAGQLGTGVTVTAYQRIRDAYLDVQYRAQSMLQGNAEATQDGLQQVQLALNEPSSSGISGLLQQYWSAWQNLSNNPEDMGTRQAMAQAASGLANGFNSLSSQLTTIQSQIGQNITTTIGQVNQYGTQIAQLNASIATAQATGQTPNDLLDQRDVLLDKLSALGNTSITTAANGSDTVTFAGATLVAGSAATALTQADMTGLTSGNLQGLITLQTTTIPGYQSQLDTIASTLIAKTNAQSAAGFDLNGNAGGQFFTGTGAATIAVNPGLVANPALIAASATGQPGDSGNALAMADMQNTALVGSATIDEAYNQLVTQIGSDVQQANDAVTNSTALVDALENQRESVSGVSLDEEMTNLVGFQRGYQASARALSAMDDMLDQLINRTGRVGL